MASKRKMYKQGLEDAMRAYEDFSSKQQEALEKLRHDVNVMGISFEKAFAEMGENINGIVTYLNAKEKAALYRLESSMDLKEMEAPEQQLLLAVLFQLAEDEGEPTEYQKLFIRSVQRYLDISNPQTHADLDAVADIDSLEVQKAFLRVVLEFYYLKDDDELSENEVEFLSNFSLNKKQADLVEQSVSRLYKAVGPAGLAEKYGYVPVEEQVEVDEDHFGLIAPVKYEIAIGPDNRNIRADEERVFENMRTVITEPLEIEGRAVFKNCEIVFDSDCKSAVCQTDPKSVLEFYNCVFSVRVSPSLNCIRVVGKCLIKDSAITEAAYPYGEKKDAIRLEDGSLYSYNASFIDVDGHKNTAVLTMEHCLIERCAGTFINADGNLGGKIHKVIMSDCRITEHTGNFILARYAYSGDDTGEVIQNCTFENCRSMKTKKELDEMNCTPFVRHVV